MTYHIICNIAAFYEIGAILIMVIMRKGFAKAIFYEVGRITNSNKSRELSFFVAFPLYTHSRNNIILDAFVRCPCSRP